MRGVTRFLGRIGGSPWRVCDVQKRPLLQIRDQVQEFDNVQRRPLLQIRDQVQEFDNVSAKRESRCAETFVLRYPDLDKKISKFENTPHPGFSAKARTQAGVMMEDLVTWYLPLYGFGEEAISNHIEPLMYVEALIYETDNANELETETFINTSGDSRRAVSLRTALASPCYFAGVSLFLKEEGLWDVCLERELGRALRYWNLERLMCTTEARIPFEKALWASWNKSLDYRVMTLLLCKLNQLASDDHFRLCSHYVEFLTEIVDDLQDYSKDVKKNSFNVYRACVQTYGEMAPAVIGKKLEDVESLFLQKLEGFTDIRMKTRHMQSWETRKEVLGVTDVGDLVEKWRIPPPILDEPSFRAMIYEV